MTHDNASPSRDPDQLRREAVELVQRHKRGLPNYIGRGVPPPAAPLLERSERTLDEGRALLAAGRLAEALLRADTVIGLAPHGHDLLAGGWTLRGEVCLQQASLQTARDAFERALNVNQAYVPARVGLAETLRRTGHHAQAITLYVETIPLVPSPDERTRLRLLLADSYVSTGQSEAARRVLRTVEDPSQLSWPDRGRALLTVLVPDNLLAWLLLLAIATVVASFTVGTTPLAGLLAFLASLMIYAAFQWWRTPAR